MLSTSCSDYEGKYQIQKQAETELRRNCPTAQLGSSRYHNSSISKEDSASGSHKINSRRSLQNNKIHSTLPKKINAKRLKQYGTKRLKYFECK